MNHSERIKKVLEDNNVTAYRLSRLIGIKDVTPIYDIMSGKIKSISSKYAILINKAFPSYSIQWLITGEDETFEDNKIIGDVRSLDVLEDGKNKHPKNINNAKDVLEFVLEKEGENLNNDIVKSSVLERIKQYLEFKGISDYRFEKDLSLSKGYANKSKNPTSDVLMKMCGIYTDISAEWLLRGEGEILKSDNNSLDKSQSEAMESMIPYYEEVIKAKDNEILRLHKEMYLLREQLEKVLKTA